MSREEPEAPEPKAAAAAGDGPFPGGLGEKEPPGKEPDRYRLHPAPRFGVKVEKKEGGHTCHYGL